MEQIDTLIYLNLSKVDNFNLEYLQNDNWEFRKTRIYSSNESKKPIFKYIFRNISDFYHTSSDDYDIHASPIVNFGYGTNTAPENLKSKKLFTNTRGVEIRGRINKKLGFYTMFSDNQTSSTNYLINFFKTYQAVPYQSFVKIKDEDEKLLQLDYFSAIGYFTLRPIKNLLVTFGHDVNFIGSGMRSMVLSDFSAPYLQLKTDLRIGRFQYLNIIGQMTNKQIFNPGNSSITFPPKYMAFHHLNINITKNFNLGVFESIMYGEREKGFELNYLNPIIFYRFIEGFLGSSDNSMVGADFKLNFLKTASAYGQFMLDEYNAKEFKKDNWWSKKYSYQIGLKYIDVFKLKNLDAQIEYNYARPFTYSHFTTSSNYVNYNLPIAHPLGANFKELLLQVRYQPLPRLHLSYTLMNAIKGENTKNKNFGGNILINNRLDRVSDYGNITTQGIKNNIKNWEGSISYMIKHNIFIDLSFQKRSDYMNPKEHEKIFMSNIRWNFAKKQMMF